MKTNIETNEQRGASIRNAFLAGEQRFRKRIKTYGDLCQQFTYIVLKYQPDIERVHKIHAALERTAQARGITIPNY